MSGVGNVQFHDGHVRGSDPDALYYNALIINKTNSTSIPTANPPISYQDTRVLPLLKDKSKYQISIDNFVINGAGKTLPIFIPQIQLGPAEGGTNLNPNNTIYSLTFTVTINSLPYQSTRYIQWQSESQTSFDQVPTLYPNYAGPQIDSAYYYCYTYSHWLKMTNNALSLAWGDVQQLAQHTPTSETSALTTSPSCTWKAEGISPTPPTDEYFNQDVAFVVGNPVTLNLSGIPDTGDISAFINDIFEKYIYGSTLVSIISGGNTCTILLTQEPLLLSSLTIVGIVQEIVGSFEVDDVCTISSRFVGHQMGTKCPFFTYNPANNLFSLWQDANTSIVDYGFGIIGTDSANATSLLTGKYGLQRDVCSPYNIFGVCKTDNSYGLGEHSYVGFNTNLESLLTNFDTIYYADKTPIYTGATPGNFVVPPSNGSTYSCVEAATTYAVNDVIYFPERQINTFQYALPNLQDADGTAITNPIELTCPFVPAVAPTSKPYYYVVVQDYQSTSSLWSPVASIIVETTFIGVREEYSGAPVQLGETNIGGNVVTGSFQKSLIEVPIEVDAQVGWRGLLRYEPKLETLSSLGHSKEELKNLNVRLLWRNRQTNRTVPLQLYSGGSTTMRLKFKKMFE